MFASEFNPGLARSFGSSLASALGRIHFVPVGSLVLADTCLAAGLQPVRRAAEPVELGEGLALAASCASLRHRGIVTPTAAGAQPPSVSSDADDERDKDCQDSRNQRAGKIGCHRGWFTSRPEVGSRLQLHRTTVWGAVSNAMRLSGRRAGMRKDGNALPERGHCAAIQLPTATIALPSGGHSAANDGHSDFPLRPSPKCSFRRRRPRQRGFWRSLPLPISQVYDRFTLHNKQPWSIMHIGLCPSVVEPWAGRSEGRQRP